MKKRLATLALLLITQTAFAFDHRHADWSALLKQQVVLITNGNASQVDYAGFPSAQETIRNGGLKIRYLDYDWAPNAKRR